MVYPRERGGTPGGSTTVTSHWGLSPRARGNAQSVDDLVAAVGSIPASAGERCCWSRSTEHSGVYPRERGGTGPVETAPGKEGGLSPRARGNASNRFAGASGAGSIPASAGERQFRLVPLLLCWVYPRERGGTFSSPISSLRRTGLSPRARGNVPSCMLWQLEAGSIPASAGERWSHRPATPTSRVYPRERGGTHGKPHGVE